MSPDINSTLHICRGHSYVEEGRRSNPQHRYLSPRLQRHTTLNGDNAIDLHNGAAAGQRGCHHQKAWGKEAEERPGAQEKISGETMNSINGLGHFVVRDDRQGITARLCHCPQVGLEQHYQVLPLQSDLVSNCVVVLGYTEN